MLLPGGPAEAGPGGVPAEGPLVSAGGGGEPPSLRDLLLPTERTQPTGPGGQEPAPGSVPDLLSRLHQPVVSGVRPPRPSAAEVERFKALVRPTMIADGVAPGQVEARLNEIVARAQRWIDEGMPNYVVPEPPRPPAPGFGEGFGDRWRATEQGIKNLFGQGGPGAPGVLESWQRMLEGTVETVQNPIGSAIGEVKDALDSPSPAYFLGAKVSDAATTLPGLFFGGEGAAIRTGLPAETVTEGGAPLAIVRGWEPTGGMAWDDFASQFGTPQARNYPLDDGFPPGFVPQPA